MAIFGAPKTLGDDKDILCCEFFVENDPEISFVFHDPYEKKNANGSYEVYLSFMQAENPKAGFVCFIGTVHEGSLSLGEILCLQIVENRNVNAVLLNGKIVIFKSL